VTVQLSPGERSPDRLAPLARLPVFLALDGRRAVIAGGNAAAAWKAELLSAAGGAVDVYAADISDELRAVAVDPPRGAIAVHARPWLAGDLVGAAIAVGTFDREPDAAVFAQAARAACVPVNIVDRPALCDFAFGAIVNRSPLVIGISTDGAAPVFAQAVRAKIEMLLPMGFALWAAAAQRWRSAVTASGLSVAARRTFWQRFAKHAAIHAERAPSETDFGRLMIEAQESGSAANSGSVLVVSAGPGEADLLTLRAVRALQSADMILFDGLVSREVLDFARREARKLLVAKIGNEDEVDALMAGLARGGKRVVRLKGADLAPPSVSSSAAPGSSATRSGAAA
jgi:uroporphyrin-III C-methyltransferase / precorrin-2 dehydrogenase / sirohydrochlorin ferrochelatase